MYGNRRGGPPNQAGQRGPQYGHSGPRPSGTREVNVVTNCFAVKKLPQKTFLQYQTCTVRIEPEMRNAAKRIELVDRLQAQVSPDVFSPKGIYDGDASLYVSHELKLSAGGSGTFVVPRSNRTNSSSLNIVVTRTVGAPIRPSDLQELFLNKKNSNNAAMATQLLQLLLLNMTKENPNFAHKKNAFFSPAGSIDLNNGLELWKGFFQAIRPTIGRMIVNIDTTIAPVYRAGPLVDVAMAVLRLNDARRLSMNRTDPNFHKLSVFLKKLRIRTRYGRVEGNEDSGPIKEIKELVEHAGAYVFEKEQGVETTVFDYFLSTYNIRLRLPDAPGVCVKKKPFKVHMASISVLRYIDALHRSSFRWNYAAKMVQHSSVNPTDRFKRITKHNVGSTDLQTPILGYGASAAMLEAGMEVDIQPITIKGKILEAPSIEYSGGPLAPNFGAWNLRDQRFKKGQPLNAWAVLNLCQGINPQARDRLIDSFMRGCSASGMNVQTGPVCVLSASPHGAIDKTLDDVLAKGKQGIGGPDPKVQCIVVFFPNHGDEVRAQVKHWGDVERGVMTQCLKEDKLQKASAQYFANVALKVNGRLGGINSVVNSSMYRQFCEAEPFMFVGVDVGHASPGSLRPSIASLVWSHDRAGSEYLAFTRLQPPREEIVQDLGAMIKTALTMWQQKWKRFPGRVVLYRDGVSEGEFEQVGLSEIKQIEDVVSSLKKDFPNFPSQIKLTFIVVGKRHHMVFFPRDDDRNTQDKTGNCRAGFTTTQGLSNPTVSDFYLQSHAAVKGTSRSSHYIVLRDEIFGDVAQIQELSYALCHVYAKATRSISSPAPVYYADIVCGREAFHYERDSKRFESDTQSVASGTKVEFDVEEWKTAYKPLHSNIRYSMYFL
ncbi:Piwi domain-containing protein [Mycena floridula]|nr:Piwi domain-containing protein [Mycena floridula]